jgi:hypothetical protein
MSGPRLFYTVIDKDGNPVKAKKKEPKKVFNADEVAAFEKNALEKAVIEISEKPKSKKSKSVFTG